MSQRVQPQTPIPLDDRWQLVEERVASPNLSEDQIREMLQEKYQVFLVLMIDKMESLRKQLVEGCGAPSSIEKMMLQADTDQSANLSFAPHILPLYAKTLETELLFKKFVKKAPQKPPSLSDKLERNYQSCEALRLQMESLMPSK